MKTNVMNVMVSIDLETMTTENLRNLAWQIAGILAIRDSDRKGSHRLTDEEKAACDSGLDGKIRCVKMIRTRLALSLAEAKRYMEQAVGEASSASP